MTARITPLDPARAQGKTKELLDAVQSKLGKTPNMMRAMAQSPAVLEGYLNLSGALSKGTLGTKLGEQLALTIGEANDCEYCLAAHTAIGGMVGLPADEVNAARQAESADPRAAAALQFANAIVRERGAVSDADVKRVRDAGFNEGQIGEIVAHVALNVFTNYFNTVARTPIDFPAPQPVGA